MSRLPSLFISHGAPTFALEPGLAGPRLTALGRQLPRPQAVLVVSPHWMTPAPRVGTSSEPETIHDFGGFDPALYRLQYPVRGHEALAKRTIEQLNRAGWPAQADARRGLDHGAWVPLMHLYPDADVPTFQVSLPSRLDAQGAWAFGRALAPLADEGVLIVGSGSLTHNLYEFRGSHGADAPYVEAFSAWVREAVEQCQQAGVRVVMVTGDHPATARAIARQAGILPSTVPGARMPEPETMTPTSREIWPLASVSRTSPGRRPSVTGVSALWS